MLRIRRFIRGFGAAVLTVILAVWLSGCNLFDGVNSSLESRTDEDRLEEATIALDRGDFPLARDLFDRMVNEGIGGAAALRGQGEALAGLAGYRLLSALDALQNGTGSYDRAPVLFNLNRTFSDAGLLEQAVTRLMTAGSADRGDRITRALMRLSVAVRQLLTKFDTNRNRRLDASDAIDFTVNDGAAPTWPALAAEFLTGPARCGATVETSALDLISGFDGKGETWIFQLSGGQQLTGTFTAVNRDTILAALDLTTRLQKVQDAYAAGNLSLFAAAVRDLDGAE